MRSSLITFLSSSGQVMGLFVNTINYVCILEMGIIMGFYAKQHALSKPIAYQLKADIHSFFFLKV